MFTLKIITQTIKTCMYQLNKSISDIFFLNFSKFYDVALYGLPLRIKSSLLFLKNYCKVYFYLRSNN